MSDIAKGGRGKKAPYESTHYRVPLPLKPIFEQMTADYRELVDLADDPAAPGIITAVVTATAARLDNEGSDVEDQEIRVSDQSTVLKALSNLIEVQPVFTNEQEETQTDQDILLDALNKFIELQQSEYGKNPAQKNKQFSMDSRGWDYFKKFMSTVKENPDILGL